MQGILSLLTLTPVPVPLIVSGPAVGFDFPSGTRPASSVEFIAWDGLGREVANSEKRGLGVELPADADPFLGPATAELTAGGTRLLWFAAETLPADLGGVFPSKTDAVIWVVGR